MTELAETIQCKLDEIMTPITELLQHYEGRLKVLFITGGGCKLNGMQEYIQSKTKLQVLYGSHAFLLAPDTPDEYYNPEFSSLVGALIMGSDYRELHKNDNIAPKRSILEKIKQNFEAQTMLLFTDQK